MITVHSIEWSHGRSVIRFYCDRCDENHAATFDHHPPGSIPEFKELAVKSATEFHEQVCPPRRGAYREALGVALRIKPRS